MKIIIAGTGEMAEFLAETLSNESQDVIVVSDDKEGLKHIDTLCNVLTICSDPRTVETLSKLKMADCKMFISLLPGDSDNVVACTVAKELGARLTVAHIANFAFSSEENRNHLRDIGVDEILNYHHIAAREILAFLKHPWAKSWTEFFDGKLVVTAIYISSDSPLAGMTLNKLDSAERHFHIAVIKRGAETIVPNGNDKIEKGDVVYIAAPKEDTDHIMRFANVQPTDIHRVVIMGGSEIGIRLCEEDSTNHFGFKMIEKDEQKARSLQALTDSCTIIKGDASKVSTLEYAGRADAFVALSKSDEVNLLACVTAREMGIHHQIAIIEDFQNFAFAEYFKINSIVNLKLLAANRIFSYLLDSAASASKAISLTDAEIVSVTALAGSEITKGSIKSLKLPKEIALLGLLHDGRCFNVNGDTTVAPGDQVVVVCRAGSIPKVQKLFN